MNYSMFGNVLIRDDGSGLLIRSKLGKIFVSEFVSDHRKLQEEHEELKKAAQEFISAIDRQTPPTLSIHALGAKIELKKAFNR